MSYYNKYSHFHRNNNTPSATQPTAMYKHIEKPITEQPAGSILLYNITPEEFYAHLRGIIKEILQQDQLLTK